ncbi:MAG: YegS/Rv2252/BmrU family lipid kinase [Thermomicrobiales bacterium]|nr:YegS/Rv2252/BmrU family lipid kinase [Thermomicrobiales bacterium]
MSERNRYLVVANPMARRGANSIVDRLQSLAPPDAELDIEFTRPSRMAPGELKERAASAVALIAIGGDGTVAEAVTAAAGAEVPLGIIPAGSTNIIARSIGIPNDLDAAARMVFGDHARRRIDVGVCNGRRFLHMGGAGFDSRMFALTSRSLKRRVGWLAYLQGASKTILSPPVIFTIIVDGQTVECESPLVLIANGASVISPSFKVHPDIRYDDGKLDIVIITAHHFVEIVRTVGRFMVRRLERSPYTIHLQGTDIEVRSSPSIPLQLDGDIIGETPARFSILPGAIELIVPR